MHNNELYNELGTNFIEYAAAVNSDRSIPDAKSGLKPVARRILYGAYIGGRTSNKPHVKNARIVGDVMGALHPHGDSSIYGALVRLSQDWIMRYPLIDFHGNQGNIMGDGPAAARYTEGRLSKLSEDGMLNGLKKRNVDFIPNYDESEEEPVTLPSSFPNLLCNPNSGIGVALACNWLPHNLNEVASAIIEYINGNENVTLPGPDFPTGGIIINGKDIPAIMKSGRGSVKVRGRYNIDKQNIVFYEIPYGIIVENLLNQISELCDSKEIEGISEVRNESNKKGLRVVIECSRGYDPEFIVRKLFTKTDLQTSISYNQVALVDKVPTELNLLDCIRIYISHNEECLVKETLFDLSKAKARKEVVDGLLKALEDIDNIIALIKKSKSSADAKIQLINKYKFTDTQAAAIVAMRLGSLAGLEKIELQNEAEELKKSIEKCNLIINDQETRLSIIKDRLNSLVKKYGDARRTEITNIEIPKEEKAVEQIVAEDVVVMLYQSGEIKRIAKSSFKPQRRNGKGVKTEADVLMASISTNTQDYLMLFGNSGQMYRLFVDDIPAATNTTKGVNVSNLIKLQPNEKIIAITSLAVGAEATYTVFFTRNGLIKKTRLDEYFKTKKGGVQAIKFKDGDSLANVVFMNEEPVVVVTKNGMGIHFETKDITAIGRVASGVKSIKLAEEDEVLCGCPLYTNDPLVVVDDSSHGKKININDIPLQGRGGKGVILSENKLIGATTAADKDNLLIIGRPNSIVISAGEIPLISRQSVGNIVIKDSRTTSLIKIKEA